MTARSILFGAAFLAAGLVSGCFKTEDHKESAASPAQAPAPPAQAAAEPVSSGALINNGQTVPVDAAVRAQAAREDQLEFRASAAEARARLAEMELQEQTARALAQQQQAAQIESARAATLALENAVLRERADRLENEQRAIEAERAAYGSVGSVIVVQPPQRHGYGRPGPWTGPQVGTRNVGLNRPAVPDLTPPGPPATFSPPKNIQPPTGEPKFDAMRARKGGVREADAVAP